MSGGGEEVETYVMAFDPGFDPVGILDDMKSKADALKSKGKDPFPALQSAYGRLATCGLMWFELEMFKRMDKLWSLIVPVEERVLYTDRNYTLQRDRLESLPRTQGIQILLFLEDIHPILFDRGIMSTVSSRVSAINEVREIGLNSLAGGKFHDLLRSIWTLQC